MNQDPVAFEKLEIDLADLQYAVCAVEWLICFFGSWVVQLDGYCSPQGCLSLQGLDAFQAIVWVVDDMSARRGDGALGTIVTPAFRRPNPSDLLKMSVQEQTFRLTVFLEQCILKEEICHDGYRYTIRPIPQELQPSDESTNTSGNGDAGDLMREHDSAAESMRRPGDRREARTVPSFIAPSKICRAVTVF